MEESPPKYRKKKRENVLPMRPREGWSLVFQTLQRPREDKRLLRNDRPLKEETARKRSQWRNNRRRLLPGQGRRAPGKPKREDWRTCEGENKLPSPNTPRASAVTITLKDRSGQSYAEMLATTNDSVSLADVGINAVRMRRTMAGIVILEFFKDQKREKSAALVARLSRILDPSKVRVGTPFRTAEARVTEMDISATKEEMRNILAKESGCKTEDVQLESASLETVLDPGEFEARPVQ